MFSMETNDYSSHIKVAGIAVVITLVMTALVLLHYQQIAKRTGTIVIPAGNTYLGPNAPGQNSQPAPTSAANVFTVAEDIPWHDIKGRMYPYTFSAPQTLTLKTFENDTYDIYAIDCCGVDPGSNVLIGLDPKADPKQTKLAYVKNWWHQFSGLKSVSSIDQFTNSKGLKGYKAKYVNSAGETPNIDVFFEVPGRPEYIIHLAPGTLDPAIFEKIIDSVAWKP